MRRVLLASACLAADALDNGLAQTPPMGWRSWNQFGLQVNQTLLEQIYEAMADRSREVDGKPTSLIDLGYTHAGIDDGWQNCSSGPTGFHDATGYPQVDAGKFPDFVALTEKAKDLGLEPGWYGNNCHCKDRCSSDECFSGDVRATLDFGFTSIKLDGCGKEKDIDKWTSLFNATGEQVLIENCNNGGKWNKPVRDANGTLHCPMHFFRTSGDIRPTFGSILKNLASIRQYNEHDLTGPGCWAYPDMLEVGVTMPQPPGALHHCATKSVPCEMNVSEWRSHFGAWCIVSAPLVLGMDLRDSAALDLAWPVITNVEAIEVNQLWAGDSGRLHAQSSEEATLPNCGGGSSCTQPSWMVFSKALPVVKGSKGTRAAVLCMNNADRSANITVQLDGSVHGLGACGDAGCAIRDIWARADLQAAGQLAAELGPHESAFFVVSSPNEPAPPSPPSPSPASDCFQHRVQFDSNKAGNVNLEDTYRKAADGFECQELCHKTPGCSCFTTNIDNGHCWLMTSCQTPTTRSWAVSGPSECPPSQSLQMV